jgi:hypothetical protein
LSASISTQLVQTGVIERRPDGLFDQDMGRWKYLTHLRERKSSPRARFAMNQQDVKMRKCTAGCCGAGL